MPGAYRPFFSVNTVQARLFAYGTLIVPSVLQAVTGQTYAYDVASLPGYARYLIKGQVFPGIIAADNNSVEGIVYHDIDTNALMRMDAFESDVYERKQVLVALQNNQQLPAYTYVMSCEYEYLLTDQPWDIEVFKLKHLADYLKRI